MTAAVDDSAAQQLRAELFGDCLSVDDVVTVLGLDRGTVLKYLRDGTIGSFQMARRWYIPQGEVRAFVERLKSREREATQ